MIAVKKHGTYLLVPAYYEAWAGSLFRRHGGLLLGHWGRAKGIRHKYAKRMDEFVVATNINVWAFKKVGIELTDEMRAARLEMRTKQHKS
jgi:hypothetical protein